MTAEKFDIAKYMPKKGREILVVHGRDFVKEVGSQTIREVIRDVLCGINLRDSTEKLTRKRIAIANGALVVMFMEGCKNYENFIRKVPEEAARQLREEKLSKEDRWILNWMLGLTGKAVQNILHDDSQKLDQYRADFVKVLGDTAIGFNREFGKIICEFRDDKSGKQIFGWEELLYLFSVIGAETLTLRGAEKSTYGKLFERLILGSLLHILDFKLVDRKTNKSFDKIFWLSERGDKRESDATLLYKLGVGVRFDIGFIGRGNTEISLDKVSRYEREMEYGSQQHYMATFIIVDRIGERSRIASMAERIDGTIVQMSGSVWPKLVAQKLKEKIGYEHEILKVKDEDIPEYIMKKLKTVEIDKFFD